jgi:hypothetical protein
VKSDPCLHGCRDPNGDLILYRRHKSALHALTLSLFSAWVLAGSFFASAESIPAKHVQGSMHGFLLPRSSEGKVIAVGDMIQLAHGARVRCRLVFHIIDDETTVFLQRRAFQLLSDHHIQKGSSFPKPLDLAIDIKRCETTSRENKDGKEQVKVEHIDLPDELPMVRFRLSSRPKEPSTKAAPVGHGCKLRRLGRIPRQGSVHRSTSSYRLLPEGKLPSRHAAYRRLGFGSCSNVGACAWRPALRSAPTVFGRDHGATRSTVTASVQN